MASDPSTRRKPRKPAKGKRVSSRKGAGKPGALGLVLTDTAALVREVRKGFLYGQLLLLQRRLGLPAEELAAYVQITPRTLARRKGEGRLRPDESERVLRIWRILEQATGLFEGDEDAARHWLTTPKKALAGEKPLEYAATEPGAREVEHLIGRLEHGVYS